MEKLETMVEEFQQASSSLKDAMRLVRSTVICMLTAVVVLLWWELIIHSLFLRAMVLTCALSIAFLVAVHDDPRYDAAVAFAVRCVETLLHKYAPSLVSGGDESNSSGQHSAAGPQWEGFGVSAGGQLVVNHRVVQEVAHVHVVGVPVAISQRYVHRVVFRDTRGHIIELKRFVLRPSWRVRDLTALYCDPETDTTVCDPVCSQRGLRIFIYFVTTSRNGDCHVHELRHKPFRGWHRVVLTRGRSRRWLVSPRRPQLSYDRGLRFMNSKGIMCRAVPHEGVMGGRSWTFETL